MSAATGRRWPSLLATVLAVGLVAVLADRVALDYQQHGDAGTQVLGEKLTSTNGNGNGNANGSSNKEFTITGSFNGLEPGVQKQLTLTVTNLGSHDLKITNLSVLRIDSVTKATGAPAGTCSASDLTVGTFTGPAFLVPKGSPPVSSSPAYIPLTLKSTAPDACQGATFNMTFSGTGVQP